MIERTGESITFVAFFTAGKVGKTGLTVTLDAHKINKATGSVTKDIIPAGSACVEVGSGLYMYRIAAGATTSDAGEYLAVFKTADTTVDQQHIPSLWTLGRAIPLDAPETRAAVGLASANLDTQLADLPTVSEMDARTLVSASYATAAGLAAVKAQTDNLPASPAAVGSAMTLANDSIMGATIHASALNKIADHTWDDTLSAHTLDGSIGQLMTKINSTLEPDAAVYRFTQNALEQAPTGTGGGGDTDWTVDEKTAIRAILGVPATGTVPDMPSNGVLNAIYAKTLDAFGVRSALGLNAANLDVQLADLPTVAELNARTMTSGTYATASELAAVKAKTDTITPLPARVDANITAVNGIAVTGSGIPGTDAWRPV